MDEETKNDLVDAAKRGLGVSYNFSDVQCSILIGIHQTYLNWDDELIGSFSEAGLKKAEEATKKYKLALRDCGLIGDILAPRVVERAFELIHFFNKTIEDEKEYCQKLGMKNSYSQKRGSPGNPKLRFYISQMAGWYKEFVGYKPGYGSRAKFRKLLNECLAVIDFDVTEPSHKIIKSVLDGLGTGPSAAYD